MRVDTLPLFTIVTLIALSSCGGKDKKIDTSLDHPVFVSTRDQAAAVLISANVAAPWDQIATAMQPNFAMANGDVAVSQVAPITARLQEQVLSAFGLGLAVSTPFSSSQSTQANNQTASQTSTTNLSGTTNSNTTTTGASGTTSTTTQIPNTQAPANIPANASLPSAPAIAGDIGIDPITKYKAALALYQAVQLMNHEVQDLAASRDYIPYLVQVKFALLPYQRNLAYDLHARLSFFPDVVVSRREAREAKEQRKNFPQIASYSTSPCDPNETTTEPPDNLTLSDLDLPFIMPVLVTDDLERAIESRAAETARQIGFAVNALIHGVGVGLSASDVQQLAKAGLGQDLNSLFTVARLIDNTLYARIGAATQPAAGLGLVGQTYDVALVLMIPKAYARLHVSVIDAVAQTEFRNAYSGEILAATPTNTRLVERLNASLQRAFETNSEGAAEWRATGPEQRAKIAALLIFSIEDSDFGEFSEFLQRICDTGNGSFSVQKKTDGCQDKTSLASRLRDAAEQADDYLTSLWGDFTAAEADSAVKTAVFRLPSQPTVCIPPQTALLVDDGKANATIQLHDVYGVADRTLTATLKLREDKPQPPDGKAAATTAAPANSAPGSVDTTPATYELALQTMNMNTSTNVLTLTFPSLKKTGIGKINNETSYLYINPWPCAKADVCANFHVSSRFNLVSVNVSSSETKPNFDFTQSVTQIRDDKGAGTVTVVLNNINDDYIKLTLTGAEYTSAKDSAGDPAAGPSGPVIVKSPNPAAPVSVTFTLDNLNDLTPVVVQAEGFKGTPPNGKSTGKTSLQFSVFGAEKR